MRFLKGRFVSDGQAGETLTGSSTGVDPDLLSAPPSGWWGGLMERASQNIDFAAFGAFASALPGMLMDLRDRLNRIETHAVDMRAQIAAIEHRLQTWEGKTAQKEQAGDI